MRFATTKLLGLLTAVALVGACSPDDDSSSRDREDGPTTIEKGSSDPAPTPSTSEPSDSTGGGGDGFPTTAVEAPDATGLPSLGEADPDTVRGRLGNGLVYYLRSNDNPGASVSMRLAVDAGSVLQEADQSGVAHFLEHMLFNGTEQFPDNELTAVLRGFGAAFGADVNAYTSSDETVYELTMPNDDEVVDTGLDVLQQWLTAATIDPDQVTSERGVVLDEFRLREGSVDGRAFAAIDRLFLDGTPYEGQQPIGTEEAISAMIPEPLRRFYDTWYRPDNAAIVVVGDIDVEDVEQGIIERFADTAARGDTPERPAIELTTRTDPAASVFADPDLTNGYAFVTLPLARADGQSLEALTQRDLLDQLAFDIIATRLSDDALAGDAPFRSAAATSSSYVRPLDAPEISVEVAGDGVEDSVTAILDEYERVRRFGVTDAEVARAVDTVRSSNQAALDGQGSRQDVDFADAFVADFLDDQGLASDERQYEFVEAVLDRATPETIAWAFVDRWERAAAHVFVGLPDGEAAAAPTVDELLAIVAATSTRPLEPRADGAAAIESLMTAPEPVEEIDRTDLAGDAAFESFEPTMLEFANGVRVVINPSTIVEGYLQFDGRSPGGLSAIDEADLPDAMAAGEVVYESGVGDIDPVAFDAFVADRELDLFSSVNVFTEDLTGYAATKDMEALFQYVHLLMSDPRVDAVALDNHLARAVPLAENPASDPEYAQAVALLDARYDDPRFLELTPAQLATVDAAGIERVMRDRYGDASDWVFAISGDFEVDVVEDLARRYLGTLPATGRVESTDFVEPAPPRGVVRETVRAGQGEQASVAALWTAPASADRRDDTVGLIVAEVLSNRLVERLREELGETYSPSASFQITGGATPNAELYVSVSSSPELIDQVATQVVLEIDDLRQAGPSEEEFAAAQAVVVEQLGFIDNYSINDELLELLVDPAGNPDIRDYLDEFYVAQEIDRDEVAAAFRRWTPPGQFIQIVTLPV
jgi:zinc protease